MKDFQSKEHKPFFNLGKMSVIDVRYGDCRGGYGVQRLVCFDRNFKNFSIRSKVVSLTFGADYYHFNAGGSDNRFRFSDWKLVLHPEIIELVKCGRK